MRKVSVFHFNESKITKSKLVKGRSLSYLLLQPSISFLSEGWIEKLHFHGCVTVPICFVLFRGLIHLQQIGVWFGLCLEKSRKTIWLLAIFIFVSSPICRNKPSLNSFKIWLQCIWCIAQNTIDTIWALHYILCLLLVVVGHNLNPCKLYMIQLAKSMFHSITLNTSNCQFGRQRIKAFCHYRFNEYIRVIMTAHYCYGYILILQSGIRIQGQ